MYLVDSIYILFIYILLDNVLRETLSWFPQFIDKNSYDLLYIVLFISFIFLNIYYYVSRETLIVFPHFLWIFNYSKLLFPSKIISREIIFTYFCIRFYYYLFKFLYNVSRETLYYFPQFLLKFYCLDNYFPIKLFPGK